ncbi:hypothetical protein CK203_087672 [Vitis vinifera]|uniref:Retrotransposon gag domain-containing protein n=1 Tax=Vitis vinifera TaxID=29760 RepID=A0A438C760_VITVI|nr:hypothetical protein CK203_087672 [Vitis vinifera]
MEATPEDQHSHHGHQDNPNAFRSMRDRMHPPRMSAPSCIVPPRAASDQTTYCSTSTNFPWDGNNSRDNGGGDFMSKNPEEAMDFLSYVAEVSRGWDEPNKGEVGKMKSQPNAFNAKAGMYTLNEDVDMKAKFAAMTRRLEELELKKMHEVQAVAETPLLGNVWRSSKCHWTIQAQQCFIWKHLQLKLEESSKFFLEAKSTSVPTASSTISTSLSLEQAIVNLSKIDNLQYSISRLTNLNTVQEKGRFPSQPHQNPKGIHEVETHEGESSQVRDVKALITLRSGKKVELPTPKPHVEEKKKKRQRRGRKSKERRKISKKGIRNASEILEVLRQVKVNIPLLDMIKQVPTYAKFLKDLCTIKRGLNVNKKAFLTEQVSAIIQCKSPLKYKDPGCPTISVMIGGKVVEKALLDLGASVNLLPYSVYKQLGLGELKPTSITLSLVDRSVKIPRGIMKMS